MSCGSDGVRFRSSFRLLMGGRPPGEGLSPHLLSGLHHLSSPVLSFCEALGGLFLSGCSLRIYKACARPTPRQKEEPGAGSRDICGFTDGGAYTQFPEAGSWSYLHCVPLTQWLSGWQDTVAVFAPTGGTGRLSVTGGIDVLLAHRLPGKPAEGARARPSPPLGQA